LLGLFQVAEANFQEMHLKAEYRLTCGTQPENPAKTASLSRFIQSASSEPLAFPWVCRTERRKVAQRLQGCYLLSKPAFLGSC
jgi:hypothetical protein